MLLIAIDERERERENSIDNIWSFDLFDRFDDKRNNWIRKREKTKRISFRWSWLTNQSVSVVIDEDNWGDLIGARWLVVSSFNEQL